MQYNGVIHCNILSGPDNNAWLADISILPKDIHIEHLFPIQYYFPCYPNLQVSENKISISKVPSKDHLLTLCHQFSIYLREMVKLMRDNKCAPIFWTLDDIMLWRAISDAYIKWERV